MNSYNPYARYGIPNIAASPAQRVGVGGIPMAQPQNQTIDISQTGMPYAVKQGMLEAKKLGWNDEKIQKGVQNDLFKQFLMDSMQNGGQAGGQPAQEGGGGIDPSAWIRELGGMGGAAGGAALGTMILPGIGTLIGGGLGGLIGGFGGSAAEQEVRDGGIDWGKAASEGLTEGAFGTLPGAGKMFSLARHAPKGARIAAMMGNADEVGKVAAAKAANVLHMGGNIYDDAGKVATSARHSDMALSGFKAGQATGGGNFLTPDDAKRAYAYARHGSKARVSHGIRAGKTARAAEDAQKVFNTVQNELTGKLDDINRLLTTGEKNKIIKAAQAAVDANPAVYGKTAQLNKLLELAKKTKDIKGLEQLRQAADDAGWGAYNAGKTSAASQARSFRTVVDDFLTKNVDDGTYKALKTEWRDAKTALELTSKAKSSGSSVGWFKLPSTGAKSKVMSRVANKGLSFADGLPPDFANTLMKGGIGWKGQIGAQLPRMSAYGGQAGGGVPPTPGADGSYNSADPFGMGFSEEQLMDSITRSGIDPETALGLLGVAGGQTQQDPMAQQAGGFAMPGSQPTAGQPSAQSQTPGMVIPRDAMMQAMMADLQATGGDNMDKLMKLFEFANYEALNAQQGATGADLTADQQKKLSGLGTVEIQLNQLEAYVNSGMFPDSNQMSASIGGFFDRNIGRNFDTDKKVFQDQLRSRGIQVIRAMGEVGNLTEAEQNAAIAALPSPGDTLQGAQQKLAILRQLFDGVAQSALTFGGYSQPQTVDPMSMGGFAGSAI